MNKKNLIGIAAIASVVVLIVLAFMIKAQAAEVSALYVKLAMVAFAAVVVTTGVYLMDTFCVETNRKLKIGIASFGAFLGLLSFLVAFDILPFLKSWNWLVSGGILYILLLQLQVLNWGRKNHNVVRFSTLFIILADVFLLFFFIAKWQSSELAVWINVAAFMSLALTFVGLFFLAKKKSETV